MEIIHADSQNFDTLIKENTYVFVDFWAIWCGPCKMVAPIVEQLAQEYDGKVQFAKVDVEDQPELTVRFEVQSIPTILFFKNGEQVDSDIGARPLTYYQEMIEKNL